MGWCTQCDKRYPNTMDFCPVHGEALVAPPTSNADPLLGMVLDDRYLVEVLIGEGAMGRVYRAEQMNVGRPVAIKVLNAAASQNSEIVTRFEAEAKIISRLRHPNTLKLLDFGHTPHGQLFIVIELLEGIALDEALAKGVLKPSRVLVIMRQILDALSEAHEQGIIHRDLKPANIMLESVGGNEVVKVVDFGIAKVVSGANVTATGRVIGTPAYMSPEQVEGLTITASSDLYSLGVLAYECLWGLLPFDGSTAVAIMLKHIKEPPPRPPPADDGSTVSKDIEDFIFSLLEKSPDRRPVSALAARKNVNRLLRELLSQRVENGGTDLSDETFADGKPPGVVPDLDNSDTHSDGIVNPAGFMHTLASDVTGPTLPIGTPSTPSKEPRPDSRPEPAIPDATRTSNLLAMTMGTMGHESVRPTRSKRPFVIAALLLLGGAIAFQVFSSKTTPPTKQAAGMNTSAKDSEKIRSTVLKPVVIGTVSSSKTASPGSKVDSGVGAHPKMVPSNAGARKVIKAKAAETAAMKTGKTVKKKIDTTSQRQGATASKGTRATADQIGTAVSKGKKATQIGTAVSKGKKATEKARGSRLNAGNKARSPKVLRKSKKTRALRRPRKSKAPVQLRPAKKTVKKLKTKKPPKKKKTSLKNDGFLEFNMGDGNGK